MTPMVPVNEMGVVVAFCLQCQEHGYYIGSIQAAFPDVVISNGQGDWYKAEFEYQASNFKAHGHDPRGCDLIICWENDWPDCPLTVWALNGEAWGDIKLLTKEEGEIAYLRIENEHLKWQLSRLQVQAAVNAHKGNKKHHAVDCEISRSQLEEMLADERPGDGWRLEICQKYPKKDGGVIVYYGWRRGSLNKREYLKGGKINLERIEGSLRPVSA